jgi:hypothetical protein
MKMSGPRIPTVGRFQPSLVLKLIFSKDEISYLFGFNGVLISQLQQYTGADVTMSFGDCDEYVVRVAGTMDSVCHTCNLVCRKFWDYSDTVVGSRVLTLRLAVAGNQCGSIIGRNGAKVNEIRDKTGAAISVYQEFLPNSNERVVEITGNGESCLQCAFQICQVLLESPPKPDTVPYVPVMWDPIVKDGDVKNDPGVDDNRWRPVFLCGDRAYVLDGNLAKLAPPEMLRRELSKSTLGGRVAATLVHGLAPGKATPEHMDPLALMTAISNSNLNGGKQSRTTREIWVRAELMFQVVSQNQGAVLGEIHRMSGAQVHVGSASEVTPSGDLPVTLSGTEDGILLAQFLIQSNLDVASKALRGQPYFMSGQQDFNSSLPGSGNRPPGFYADDSLSHSQIEGGGNFANGEAFCALNQVNGGPGPFHGGRRER